MRGIDVSHWQSVINWNRVKRSGVRFAMIKATEGADIIDSQFFSNIKNATAVGIPCGVFHYLQALTVSEAKKEADFFIDTVIKSGANITLWAALDVEEAAQQQLGRQALTDMVLAFLQRVEERGFKPMLYANGAFISYYYDYGRLKQYPLWYACWYDADGEADRPVRDFDYFIWQQGTTSVDGIYGAVDNDYGYFDLPDVGEYIKAGDLVQIKPGACYYGTKTAFPDLVLNAVWIVESVDGDRAIIDKSEDGAMQINSAINTADLVLITPPTDRDVETGDIVHICDGAKYYGTDIDVPSFVLEKDWIVTSASGDRVVIDFSTDGTMEINSAVYAQDLTILGKLEDDETEIPEAPETPAEPDIPQTPPQDETTPENPQQDEPEPTEPGNETPGDETPAGGENNGSPNAPENPDENAQNAQNPDDEIAEDAEDLENGLVAFFKLIFRAALIAIRSIFGKKYD